MRSGSSEDRRPAAMGGRFAMHRVARLTRGIADLGIALALAAAPIAAQGATNLLSPDTIASGSEATRLVSGRVVRPDSQGVVGVVGVRVTLHRVGSDTAGALDSARTGANGAYSFRYRRHGRTDAVYFVSARYAGIAYFSLPLMSPRVVGDSAEITVFDTTSQPVPLRVRGRHLIVTAPNQDGTRDIIEVYELTNDSTVTLVSTNDAHPTWTALLPSGATNFAVGQSGISPKAVTDEAGKVVVVAPFAPGLKQLSFSYQLPAAAFPLAIPITQSTTVLEVLTGDPRATVSGARLARVASVSIEGRPFQRYLAQDVPASAVVSVGEPPPGGRSSDQRYLITLAIALAVAMVGALALALARQRPAAQPGIAGTAAIDPAQELAREIADLNAGFERAAAPTAAERRAYEAERAVLKESLARALDARRAHR